MSIFVGRRGLYRRKRGYSTYQRYGTSRQFRLRRRRLGSRTKPSVI